MTGATSTIIMILGAFAIGPVGALLAASLARQFHHVVIMLYWIGGFATAAHATLVFGS